MTKIIYTCKACLWTSDKVNERTWGDNNKILSCNQCGTVSLASFYVDKQVYKKYNNSIISERDYEILSKTQEDLNILKDTPITYKGMMKKALKD